MPTIQPADLWRESGRYDDYGKEMLRIKDRHERDMLFGPTNEEMVTEIFRSYVQFVPRAAAQPLSHPVEVPRRGAAALRRHARTRIPDEGRLFLRPRPGERASRLQPHVRRLSPDLRAARPEGDSDARRFRADRRRHEPRIHHPRRDRRERGVLLARSLDLPVPGADIDFRSDLSPIVEAWTAHYAATDEKHDPAAFAALPEDKRIDGARHRGRAHLLFRHQILASRWAPR